MTDKCQYKSCQWAIRTQAVTFLPLCFNAFGNEIGVWVGWRRWTDFVSLPSNSSVHFTKTIYMKVFYTKKITECHILFHCSHAHIDYNTKSYLKSYWPPLLFLKFQTVMFDFWCHWKKNPTHKQNQNKHPKMDRFEAENSHFNRNNTEVNE